MPELVAIDLPGGPEFVAALRRAWDAGDAVLPLDQRLAPAAQAALLGVLGAGCVVGPGGARRAAPAAGAWSRATPWSWPPAAPRESRRAWCSPTTPSPRRPRATSARLGVDPSRHRWLACLPLNHVGGLSVVTRALLTGTPLTVLPGFDADRGPGPGGPDVLVSLVPTALGRVGAEHFHTVVLGGSAPPADLPGQRRHHLRADRDGQRRGLRRRPPRRRRGPGRRPG